MNATMAVFLLCQAQQAPAYSGEVRLAVFTRDVALGGIETALKDVAGVSNVRQVPDTGEFRLDLSGTFADLARIKAALSERGISAEIKSPARVVIRPDARPKDSEKVLRSVKEIPGVGAAGLGWGWGLPDPMIGVLSDGVALDAKPLVSGDGKYVRLDVNAQNVQLLQMRQILLNDIVAFADLDAVKLHDLQKAVESCGVRGRMVSHEELRFSFGAAGSVEELEKDLGRVRGVVRVQIDADAKEVKLVAAKAAVRTADVRSAMKRRKFTNIEDAATKRD
jgi:copper chaperone CopZ